LYFIFVYNYNHCHFFQGNYRKYGGAGRWAGMDYGGVEYLVHTLRTAKYYQRASDTTNEGSTGGAHSNYLNRGGGNGGDLNILTAYFFLNVWINFRNPSGIYIFSRFI
jgi:hypothetical protein